MQVQDAYKLQDYFTILRVLKIFDDVLIFCLQEEFTFNECDQTIIQKCLPHPLAQEVSSSQQLFARKISNQ